MTAVAVDCLELHVTVGLAVWTETFTPFQKGHRQGREHVIKPDFLMAPVAERF